MKKLDKNQLLQKQISDIYGKNFKLSDFDKKTQLLLSKVNNTYHNLEYKIQQNNVLFEEEESVSFVIGMNDGVLRANKKFYETFGFKGLKDFKSKYTCVCELFIEEDGYLKETSDKAHWTQPILLKPNKRHKALIRDHRGRKSVYLVSLKNIFIEETQFKICTFTDITELEEAVVALRKSEDAKSVFMANMSHEIRTPMNGIIGFTKLLLKAEVSNEQKEFLEIIETSAEDLSKNVEVIDSIAVCPSEIYRAISNFNDLLILQERESSFDLNVLVAEDYRVNRMVLDKMLLKYGIKADFAMDGHEAVEMAIKGIYDIILMDINMPNLNGIEASEKLRSKGVDVPIIAVTTNLVEGDKERLLKLGIEDYMAKPLNVDNLYNILYKYSRRTLIDID